MKFITCVLYILGCLVLGSHSFLDQSFQQLDSELRDYFRDGILNTNLEAKLSQYDVSPVFEEHVKRTPISSILDKIPCDLCLAVADAVTFARNHFNVPKEKLLEHLTRICTILIVTGEVDERVCRGVLDLNLDTILYIIDNGNHTTVPFRFCASALQSFNCSYEQAVFEWEIDIPEQQYVPKKKPKSDSAFNILHISDIHYDPYYTAGVSNKCGEPLCCQSDQAQSDNPATKCGYWSEYTNADTPGYLVEDLLQFVNKTHDFDFVYYTGDIISHRVWGTSVINNTQSIKDIYGMMKKHFTVPVYPALGNHESNPLNQWTDNITDPTVSQQWLYDLIAEEWSEWLPESTKATIKRGGFYTVTPKKGLRLIVLNSNVCYTYNWWLVYDDVDPLGQLKWLVEVLLEAEKNQERVHIIGHVPTGSDECLKVWGREYHKIVERFSETIASQFNGHTHFDQFYVYYDRANANKTIGAIFNGASVTTWLDNNPSYKLYEVDEDSFSPLDYEEWTFNVTEANLTPDKSPEWYKLYRFTEAYNVTNLDAEELSSLVFRMAEDHALIDQYNKFYFRNGDLAIAKPCDEKCQKRYLCEIVASEVGDDRQCDKLKEIYDSHK